MIGVRDLIGWEWDLRLHKGSFVLGLAAGAAAGAAVVAAIQARQQRARQREEGQR